MFSTPFTFLSAGPTNFVLDAFPGATLAYSVRKLRSTYTGSCLKVRRSSDNDELDIGFVGQNLNTSALTTFVGAGDGFVTTWYDQSFSGVNPVQATTTKQPRVVVGGVVQTENGKPAILFDGVNDFMKTPSSTTTLQMYSLHQYNGNNSVPIGFNTGDIDYSFGRAGGSIFMIANVSAIFGSAATLNAYLNQSIWFGDYTTFNILRNNASVSFGISSGTPPAPAAVSQVIVGNRKIEDFPFNGKIQEQICYPSASDNIGITNNINAFFSVF